MKKAVLISLFSVCVAAIAIFVALYFFRDDSNENEITLYGNVDVRQVDIGFRVAGQVVDLYFEEGDVVEKGALMCTLDTTPYDSKLTEAIAAAEAVGIALENAEILLNRRLELITVGAVSQEDLDNALANRDQLKARLIEAEAAVVVAEDNLSYTKAYSLNKGILLTRIREPGTVVNPADPVYTLSISDPVWIRAFVDEPDLGKVHYGMDAKVFTDTGNSYSGKVGFISPVAEFTPKTVETPTLRTDLVYRIRVYVDKPDNTLLQGMPVTVKLEL